VDRRTHAHPGVMPHTAGVTSRTVLLVGLGWLLLAIGLGAAGIIRTVPPPAAPLVVVGLTAVVLSAGWLLDGLRAWLLTIDARWLVALHLTRFVGVYFLYLYGQGRLPYAFAVPGGWGDIAVASLAAILLVAGPPRRGGRRSAYILWNVLGFADILFVVATAARLAIADPGSMAALLRLPLSLLPTFLVPLIIASHVVLGVRLARDRAPHGVSEQ
jgi:hypothetical protein